MKNSSHGAGGALTRKPLPAGEIEMGLLTVAGIPVRVVEEDQVVHVPGGFDRIGGDERGFALIHALPHPFHANR